MVIFNSYVTNYQRVNHPAIGVPLDTSEPPDPTCGVSCLLPKPTPRTVTRAPPSLEPTGGSTLWISKRLRVTNDEEKIGKPWANHGKILGKP